MNWISTSDNRLFVSTILLLKGYTYYNTWISTYVEPTLSPLLFSLIFYGSLVVFIMFSFRPPSSFLHSLILILSFLTFFLSPGIFGAGEYPQHFIWPVYIFIMYIGTKMIVWLKNCGKYEIAKKDKYYKHEKGTQSDVQPFFWSLFYWRQKDTTKGSQSQIPFSSPTRDQIKQRLNVHYSKLMTLWISQIIIAYILEFYPPKISNIPYPIRFINYLHTGTPFISLHLVFSSYLMVALIRFSVGYLYELFVVASGHILLLIHDNEISTTSLSWLFSRLTSQQLHSIKQWSISLLFHAKPLFNDPYLAESPRDFWSVRWHQSFNGMISEIGYKPVRRYFYRKNFFGAKNSRKIGDILGILATFFVSGVVHEYIIYIAFGDFTGEQVTFLIFHGLLLVIWEGFVNKDNVGGDNGKGNSGERIGGRILKFIVWNFISIITLPWFAEAYIRNEQYHSALHLICKRTFNLK